MSVADRWHLSRLAPGGCPGGAACYGCAPEAAARLHLPGAEVEPGEVAALR